MRDCESCRQARETGWWGHSGTHCGLSPSGSDCHRSWTGHTESHCEVCHQHFTSDAVADLHEPYCTADRVAAAESMRVARGKNGNLLFDTSPRKAGPAWKKWDAREHYQVAT